MSDEPCKFFTYTGNVWDEITYPFPNFNGATIEVWDGYKQFHCTIYIGCNYLSMLGLKLIHVSKRSSWGPF